MQNHPSQLSGNWNYPTTIKAGSGRMVEVPSFCRQFGISAPLIVTDPGLVQMPFTQSLVQSCRDAGLKPGLFSDIQPNPIGKNVSDGVLALRSGHHDGVIALGGGSAMDAGKAIAFLAGQTRPLWDFEDRGDNFLRADAQAILPVIAIPTTAGTGSEVGRASIITDENVQTKKIIFHPRMLPCLALLDPDVTVGLPSKLTAATGMDALSHNLEALCSPIFHPIAEGLAVEGIRLVFENLPLAVKNGQDSDARLKMLVASSMGAAAFQKGLGAMHALAHPLGALFNAHHGMLNAILMPYVLVANWPHIQAKLQRLAAYLDLQPATALSFLTAVLELRQSIGIPHSLSEIGLSPDRSELVVAMALEDPSAATNPIPFQKEDYHKILSDAIHGTFAMPA